AWIFFRATNIKHAFDYISEIFSSSFFTFPVFDQDDSVKPLFILLIIFVLIEWFGREQQFAIQLLKFLKYKLLRYVFYYGIIFIIFWFSGDKQEFIYFQF
ncbi:MAG: alginate O-acetyltransferase complex protein AlgI, partial [Sediminicola sp.]